MRPEQTQAHLSKRLLLCEERERDSEEATYIVFVFLHLLVSCLYVNIHMNTKNFIKLMEARIISDYRV